ncbi:hypothetical protein [Rhodococcus sp. USK13]|uniref:hypothetical protein n=1 Tax=Rhodococcus sp. USK13 TaxID=2806442 RepID=UPI001BCCC5D2|nr:hypothetical protein [Rhodococcus sp. USK13]
MTEHPTSRPQDPDAGVIPQPPSPAPIASRSPHPHEQVSEETEDLTAEPVELEQMILRREEMNVSGEAPGFKFAVATNHLHALAALVYAMLIGTSLGAAAFAQWLFGIYGLHAALALPLDLVTALTVGWLGKTWVDDFTK